MANISLLFLFLISRFALADGEMCTNTGQTWTPFQNMQFVELDRKIAKEAIRKDFKGFCQWNRMDRLAGSASYGYGMGKYRVIKATGDLDMEAQYLANGPFNSGNSWEMSMYGHPLLKNQSPSVFFNICAPDKAHFGISIDCAGKIVNALTKGAPNINYAVPDYYYDPSQKVKDAPTKLKLACIAFSPKSVFDCASTSKDLFDILKPGSLLDSHTPVTAIPFIWGTLLDKKITAALQRVSVSLWKRIEKKEFGKNDNIFTELSAELMKDGFTEKKARKKALLILGAIATGGPNFYSRIDWKQIESYPQSCESAPGCNPNGIYMQAIAEGMVHADTFKMLADAPAPYSLPAGSDFQCDIGKSYHFWLSAALTNLLIEMGHPAEAARAAVFASDAGYQLGGVNGTRGSNQFSMPRYGSIENGIRMDLNLSSAGTAFGAQIENPPSVLPLKDGLLKIIDAGNTKPARDEAFDQSPAKVLEWMDRIGASTAFGAYP